jgi:hypothetical protein
VQEKIMINVSLTEVMARDWALFGGDLVFLTHSILKTLLRPGYNFTSNKLCTSSTRREFVNPDQAHINTNAGNL